MELNISWLIGVCINVRTVTPEVMPPAELATASIRNPFVLAKVSPGEVGEYSADWCSE